MKAVNIPDDLKEMAEIISPSKFIKYLAESNHAPINGKYSRIVQKQCHNSVGWAVRELMHTEFFYGLEICHGLFDGVDHSWLKVGDYYFDLTMAQFDSSVDNLFVSLEEDCDHNNYSPIREIKTDDRQELFEWLKSAGR